MKWRVFLYVHDYDLDRWLPSDFYIFDG